MPVVLPGSPAGCDSKVIRARKNVGGSGAGVFQGNLKVSLTSGETIDDADPPGVRSKNMIEVAKGSEAYLVSIGICPCPFSERGGLMALATGASSKSNRDVASGR